MTPRWKRLRWIIAVLLLCGLAHAQEPLTREASQEHDGVRGQVRLYFDRDYLTIADSLHLTVEVVVPKGYKAELPKFEEYGFALDFNDRSTRFRPTDIGEPRTELRDGGSVAQIQEFTLEPWLSGEYSVPPLMVSFFKENDDDNAANPKPESAGGDDADLAALIGAIPDFSVITNGVRIQVAPIDEARSELSDLYGQSDLDQQELRKRERRDEDKSNDELVQEQRQQEESALALEERAFPWWIVWTIGVIGIAIATTLWLSRRRIADFLSPKRRPAHEIAYLALRELESKGLPQKGMTQEFYYELSYILREYIGNRFAILAMKQTTEEFLRTLLTNNPFDSRSESILRDFSEHADSVKYSRYRPDSTRAEQSFGVAKSFVDTTKLTSEGAA